MAAVARLAKPFLALLFAGCAAGNVPTTSYTYEYSPPEQQALAAVDETNPSFLVHFGDEHYATERLGYFAKVILQSAPKSGGTNTVTGETTINLGSQNFIYTVRKAPSAEGVRYMVSCLSRTGGQDDAAVRNAKNLARFVQSGQLEKLGLTL